ncbi:unnamed protein product [Protopolystoma xenopodis]|uniref:Uncharacterized protein n=1 Tax=Protopolystoma xenopodis TaxID=117903 RepID=A0A3S4ZTD1_9PLAT|nr:unnamed protein product [Protopolystoma xenopodis]
MDKPKGRKKASPSHISRKLTWPDKSINLNKKPSTPVGFTEAATPITHYSGGQMSGNRDEVITDFLSRHVLLPHSLDKCNMQVSPAHLKLE